MASGTAEIPWIPFKSLLIFIDTAEILLSETLVQNGTGAYAGLSNCVDCGIVLAIL